MLSLCHLPAPPPLDKITACENDGQLRSFSPCKANEAIKQTLGIGNIQVTINQESARPAQSKYEAKEAFSAHTETVCQRLISAYHEDGIIAAIHQIKLEENNISPLIWKLATCFLSIFDQIEKLKVFIPLQASQARKKSSQTLDISLNASSCSIVSISWHPHCSTLAAVFGDDTIRIYGKGRSLTPLLKHRLQKNITHIEWMSFSASILAVGCESGILLWTLDPISVVTRPSGSCLTYLAHPETIPTSSFSWHPKGLSLACVGGKGRDLVIWDVSKEDAVTVHSGLFSSLSSFFWSSTFSSLLWSPDGTRLLAAMASCSMRVFECQSWAFEQWNLECPLQSAVWSQCGQLLLFATQQEPFLYSLSFSEGEREGDVGGSSVAIQVADLSPISITCEDGEEERVGGPVKQLAWDPKSERLAVLFKESELVALFHTHTKPLLHLAPGGFIRGEAGHVPLHICFQKNVENGSILSIVWSGGVVKHMPLCYTPREPMNVTLNSSLRPLNQTVFHSPTSNNNQSTFFNVCPTSPMMSPLSSLFTSPS